MIEYVFDLKTTLFLHEHGNLYKSSLQIISALNQFIRNPNMKTVYIQDTFAD